MTQNTTELHHSTKKIREQLPTYRVETGSSGHMTFQEKLEAITKEFHLRGSEGESYEKTRSRGSSPSSPVGHFGHLSTEFHNMERLYKSATDLKKSTDWNEIKVHMRNVLFRGLTTLVIGGSIMFIYWLAAKWGIQLPLLRIPV